MQLEWWHFGGLLMGFVQAAFLLINQHFRIEPRLLMFWRGFGIAALALPFALYFGPGNWPHNPYFYAAATATGLLVAFFDRLLFRASAQYGAGVTSRLLAICLPLAFLLWLALHPGHMAVLSTKPHIMWLPVALLGTLVSVLLLKRDAVSRAAFIGLLPLYFLGAGIDVLNKTSMLYGNGLPGYFVYAIIVSLMAGFINILWPDRKAQPATLRSVLGVWRGGVLVVLIGCFYIVLKASSLTSAPNPAFITALNLTGPFWVMMWNIATRHPDNTNILAGFGCVASALLLVFATV